MTTGEVFNMVLNAATILFVLTQTRNIKSQTKKQNQEYYQTLSETLEEKLRAKDIIITKLENDIVDCNELRKVLTFSNTAMNRLILKQEIRDMRVFVLDDSDYTQEFFKEHFEAVGFVHVEHFTSLKDIEDCLFKRPEIMVLDYKINGIIDGLMVKISAIKTDDYNPFIIVMSGISEDYINKKPWRKDVNMFFPKGHDGSYIKKVFEAILSHLNKSIL